MPGYQPRVGTDHVFYNGVDIHDFSLTTNTGVRVLEVRGWDEKPDVRDVRELRSGQDGEYADNLYLGGRTITLSGYVIGSSWVNLQARKRALAATLQPTSSEVLLKIPDPATASPTAVYATTGMTGYERSSVRVVESIAFGDMIGSAGMTWQIVVRASDPRIYNDVETSTDSGTTGTGPRTASFTNTGTYSSPARVTVTGPLASSFTVSEANSGFMLTASGPVLSGTESGILDTSDRTYLFASTYAGVRLVSPGLSAIWPLNETSGTTAVNAQGTTSRNGTYAGTYVLNQTGPSSGIPSVDLDGISGRIAVPFQAGLASTDLTFEAWVRPDTLPSLSTILDCATSGLQNGWQLTYSSNGAVSFVGFNAVGAVSWTSQTGPGAVVPNQWTHVVVTRTTGDRNALIYINGSVGGVSSLNSSAYVATAQGFSIGRSTAAASYLDGRLGPIAYWNRSLSSVEVSNLYAARASTPTTSAYTYIAAGTSRWAPSLPGANAYVLSGGSFSSGTKLNVTFRPARI